VRRIDVPRFEHPQRYHVEPNVEHHAGELGAPEEPKVTKVACPQVRARADEARFGALWADVEAASRTSPRRNSARSNCSVAASISPSCCVTYFTLGSRTICQCHAQFIVHEEMTDAQPHYPGRNSRNRRRSYHRCLVNVPEDCG
jgi:hypothetical protein